MHHRDAGTHPDVTWGLWGFCVFQHQTHSPRRPSPGGITPVCISSAFAHGSALFTQSHLVASLVANVKSLLFVSPVLPSSMNASRDECPANCHRLSASLPALPFPTFHKLIGDQTLHFIVGGAVKCDSLWLVVAFAPAPLAFMIWLTNF